MGLWVVPLSCPGSSPCCKMDVSAAREAGDSACVACVCCGRETTIGFATKYGREEP